MAPELSLPGIRLIIPDHALGAPVLRALSLCTCCRHYPGAAAGCTYFAHSPSRLSLPRKGHRVGLRIVLFEACSAFTRVTACTLALSPVRDTHSEGFSYFVTSIAAPVASGWSVRRVGLAPTGKRRLVTAHTHSGHCQPLPRAGLGGYDAFWNASLRSLACRGLTIKQNLRLLQVTLVTMCRGKRKD
jgi:hypothetical protein